MFKTLQMNSRGDEVKQLQVVLNTLLKPSPNLAVDGDFGNGTQAAVMRFQRIHGMNATGIAGWTFWAEVMREKSIDLAQSIATNTLLNPLQGLIILYQRVIAPTALAQLAVSYALKENGVREDRKIGNNYGKRVEEYLASVNEKGGAAWCLGFV